MSNASLKEQLQAVTGQLTTGTKELNTKKKYPIPERVKTSKPKPKWLEYVQYGVELLKAYYPSAFREANDVKPLKKGIKQDLVKALSTLDIVTEDKACMVKSLAYYVNTALYHKSVVEGVERIDLTGQPAGLVTAEEAKYSVDRQKAKMQVRQGVKPEQKPNNRISTPCDSLEPVLS